ncbi:hypothetical protein RQM65_07955 [Pricia sp. S334]|uniref:Toxin-antitoxin system HicB family antitoxin n=1 Tax=Pricia mediterranea TaxID=3076079 RepID=A0ABU3L5V6_9FLAO|nr:hypothetical protein [Pricia sp. S334]MDT7828594.1 hypothetical protein [Pricia sp. S334]
MKLLKVQTAFRFDEELLELVKEKAKAQRRSLNNYIEGLLHKDVGSIPNEETKKAIEEARSSKNLERINDLDTWVANL